ncbi:Neuropeptide-like 1 [Araneus ventricosus]|uniref:Neuropeptide-like 1 n=1 Tax=Araneus ventricosus TaxID=182803 RepID=A0A4Y2LVA3_ARAVE|nr:Neuropeptide-like 1 [Araneus ventricosus]
MIESGGIQKNSKSKTSSADSNLGPRCEASGTSKDLPTLKPIFEGRNETSNLPCEGRKRGWVIFHSQADDDIVPDKRYVAALAKNGRLPKFITAQKKDSKEMSPTEDSASYRNDEMRMEYPNFILSEDKRNIGAFFESRGRPSFTSVSGNDPSESNGDTSSTEAKRNVATLARLGRLNAIRYGRLQSRLVGAKRINNDQNIPVKETNDEANDIDVIGEIDCHDGNEEQVVELTPNWQKKRYVAALARSGRLPIWHSQRMWGAGKRDDSYPYGDDSRYNGDNDDMDNAIDETARVTPKYKRCKKVYGFEPQKRNIAALAKNGRLPFNAYQDDKRNIQAMARNGNLPFSNYQDEKRNIQAMARNGNLPFSNYQDEKRNIQAMARNGNLRFNNQDSKRNVQAMARNGKLPSFSRLDEKRNVQAMARNGKLPSFSYQDDKRNVQAMARNGKLPSFSYQDGKRNVQAMARNGNLPFTKNEDEKRNVQAMARKGLLSSFSVQDGKRNVQAMARNGNLPFTKTEDDKRNIQSMARNGKLLYNSYGNEKRNIQAMARSGKLLFNSYPNGKRSEEESEWDENTAEGDFQEDKRNLAALARKGKLPFSNMKRNLAAMARNGKLPFNNYPTMKREEDESMWEDNASSSELQEDKRNVAALARNGKLPGQSYREGKRNIAALARNGKLPAFNEDGKRNIGSLARKGMLPVSV